MTSKNERFRRSKGRRVTAQFARLPHRLLNHESFRTLSPRATKFLVDLAAQYNGYNNGDLSATKKTMLDRGWNSSDQLNKAKREAEERGLIRVTRQGGRNRCNLYALTWFQIDECRGKHDATPTSNPPNDWVHWVRPCRGSK